MVNRSISGLATTLLGDEMMRGIQKGQEVVITPELISAFVAEQAAGGVDMATQAELDAVAATINNKLAIVDDNDLRTIGLGDFPAKFIRATGAGAAEYTVPTNVSAAIPIGSVVTGMQYGAGQVTFVAEGGATIRTSSTLKTRAQYSCWSLVKIATNEWVLSGDLAAS